MSCFNQQYGGMADYGGRDGSMPVPGWQAWPMNVNPADFMDGYAQMGTPPAEIPQENRTLKDLGSYPLAMAYVPIQRWTQPLPIEKALTRGTIFAELDLPFMMGRCQ